MKKIITLIVLLMLLAVGLYAKPKEKAPYGHELSLSYSLAGIGIPNYSSAALWSAFLTDGRVVKNMYGPGLLEYYHSFNRFFSFGGILNIGKADGIFVNDSGTFSSWNIGFAPSFRFTWFQHSVIRPYSKVSLGLGILNLRDNDSSSKVTLTPEAQIIPIGIMLGKGHLCWLLETGWGSYGWCLTGLNFRF